MVTASSALSYPGSVALNLDDSLPDYFAFGFQQNSEWLNLYNSFILQLRESGVLAKIVDKWMPKPDTGGFETESANALGFENLSFPFIALGTGVLLAVIIGGIEKLCEAKPVISNATFQMGIS